MTRQITIPRAVTIFHRFGVKIERTDYKRGSVFDLLIGRNIYVSLGRKHFRFAVLWR